MAGDGSLQTLQMVNETALDEFGNAARQALDSILSDVNSRIKDPCRISVTGSSLVISIGTSKPVGPLSKERGLPIIGGVDIGAISGTIDAGTGTGTSAVQSATFPTMTASYYVRVGFEIRSDKNIYLVFGSQASSAAAAGAPAFTPGALMQIGEITLQDDGTGGAGNFLNPAMSNIVQYVGGGSGSGSSNPPLRLYGITPADSKVYIDPARRLQSDNTILTAPVIANKVPDFGSGSVAHIDLQNQTTSGGTFTISFPSSTVGRYRLLALSLMANDVMKATFSSEVTSLGLLPDPGTLFDPAGVDVGYLILECTDTSGKFKTAGSSTSVIENSVGGNARIFNSELYPPRSVAVSNYDNIVIDPVSASVVVDLVSGTVVYS